ncbi:hypothetical protein Zm00014a_015145 [Zea mays]|uniref:Retrotransposon-like protein n=3 Tax=Zea mays TaxID=4577 RepID=A0A3L6FPI1_MAIZE|nr:hypothetical protein Zm00014a_015145 [Zea mays]
MLDEHNPFAKKFRLARERLNEHTNEEFIIRIVGAREGDPVQYNMPTTDDLAMLVIGDFSLDTFKRDIIIETRNSELRRISSLHPAYMALQYPLLFPYGERGFQVGVLYSGIETRETNSRTHMTMQDYYCYQFHYKSGQPNPFLSYGTLSNQAKIYQVTMLFTLVAELHPQSTNAIIRVRVIRKWEFRGATNDGPLQHINLVLADEQGTPIHAEIAAALAVDKGSMIEIEKVYELKRFRVTPSRNYFKPVDNNFMIQFTLYTQAKVVKDPPQVFPRYIYKLTCFENIEDNIDNRTYLIDVLGMLTQINPPHLIGYNNSTIIRDIFIKNTSDMSLKITLWGNQASSFSISDVYNQSNNQPIVILLVRFLAKRFKGQPYLSSTTASSWYFNPGIPEAQTYYNRLQNNDLQLIQPTAAEEEILLSQPPNLEQKTVEELLNIDPDMFPPEGYRCTVTISRIVQNSNGGTHLAQGATNLHLKLQLDITAHHVAAQILTLDTSSASLLLMGHGDAQRISELNNEELSSPPKRMKHGHSSKGIPDLTDPKEKSS